LLSAFHRHSKKGGAEYRTLGRFALRRILIPRKNLHKEDGLEKIASSKRLLKIWLVSGERDSTILDAGICQNSPLERPARRKLARAMGLEEEAERYI